MRAVGALLRAVTSAAALVALVAVTFALSVLVQAGHLSPAAGLAALILLAGLSGAFMLATLGLVMALARTVAVEAAEAADHRAGVRRALGFPRDSDLR
jgi:hypothetical protein